MRRKDKDIGRRFETDDFVKPPRDEGPHYDTDDPDMDMSDPDLKIGSDEWLAEELLKIAQELAGSACRTAALAKGPALTDEDKAFLDRGNIDRFAEIFVLKMKADAAEAGVTSRNYRSRIDYDEYDNCYIVWHDNADKSIYNSRMELIGVKQY